MNTTPAPGAATGRKTYHCGTLTYTKAGLLALFAWLLWGDFCYTVMEAVVPSVLPLKLKALGSPNWMMGLIMTTLPGILNMTICPWVSFKSDRYRSRWGRRIPFIIVTLPFLCASLALLGASDDITRMIQHWLPEIREYAPATVTIGLIAIFSVTFQFFNMFVGSVFWYLFNDVVPAQFLGRFIGTFRIVGVGAGALYNYFIFKYANTHMREIFMGAALLYFVGFGIMCLMVREGEYPPIEGEADKDNKGWGGIKTFLKESFSHKFYWLRFLSTSFTAASGGVAIFNVFYYQQMNLNLDQIGKMSAIGSVAVMVATYFMAVFVDRWHPLRIGVYAAVFGVIANMMSWMWIFVTLPGNCFFWLTLGGTLITALLSAITGVASLPCEMRIFPQSRFGQFCSAQATLAALFRVAAGILGGLFMDFVRWLCNGSDFAYRFNFLWATVFVAISAVFLVYVYIEWNRMGGDKHFHPPAPWSKAGVEEMPIVPTVGPQTRWLNIAFLLFDGVMVVSALGVPLMMGWMYLNDKLFAFQWYGLILLPLSLLAWVCWIILKKNIRRDMAAARAGLPLRNGIPHHGMLIIIGSKFFLALGIWVAQVVVTLFMNEERDALVFGIAHVATNFLLIGAFYLLCRIERGFSVTIDEEWKPLSA